MASRVIERQCLHQCTPNQLKRLCPNAKQSWDEAQERTATPGRTRGIQGTNCRTCWGYQKSQGNARRIPEHPRESQRDPEGTRKGQRNPRETKGAPREPKGGQGEPERGPRGPNGALKGPWGVRKTTGKRKDTPWNPMGSVGTRGEPKGGPRGPRGGPKGPRGPQGNFGPKFPAKVGPQLLPGLLAKVRFGAPRGSVCV